MQHALQSHVLSRAVQVIICCMQLAGYMTQLQWYDSGWACDSASETELSALLQLNIRLLWNAWSLEKVVHIEKPQEVYIL